MGVTSIKPEGLQTTLEKLTFAVTSKPQLA
jgi:hypothetical protein